MPLAVWTSANLLIFVRERFSGELEHLRQHPCKKCYSLESISFHWFLGVARMLRGRRILKIRMPKNYCIPLVKGRATALIRFCAHYRAALIFEFFF